MHAFLLCASSSKFGLAGWEDIWVMTHYCRCTQSVRHGLEPDIFLLDPPTQSLSKLYFGLVYCNSFNDTDFFPSYCGEY